MAEYVDKQEIYKITDPLKNSFLSFLIQDIERFVSMIPNADVQPVKHGKWLDLWVEDDEIIGGGFMIKQCSVCKEEMYYGEPRYCPDCGAKMDGET